MDGDEAASPFRRETPSRDTLIAAVIGYGQEKDRQRSAAPGIDLHLFKQVAWTELLPRLSLPGAASEGNGVS